MTKKYLSYSGNLWRVIVGGVPICTDKATRAEALAAAAQYRVSVTGQPVWNGDRGEWVHYDSFDDLSTRDIALMEWADETDPDPYADSEWAAGCNG